MVAKVMAVAEILTDFPYLSAGDVAEALHFAAAPVDRASPHVLGVRLLLDGDAAARIDALLREIGHDASHVGDTRSPRRTPTR